MGSLVVQGEFGIDNVNHWRSFGEEKNSNKIKKDKQKKRKRGKKASWYSR
jgi:hypothetical protein